MTVEWALERLRQLRAEYTDGESQLLQLERHRARVQQAMLRASGAIQVLEEMIAASGAFAPDAFAPDAFAPDAFPPDAFPPDADRAPSPGP